MVFYRKYRPQKIEELDSKEIRDKLYNVLGNSSVSHAFLFTGPKGLGKTSAARIVAKALNCEKRWDVGNEKIDTDVKSEKVKVKKNQKIPPQNPVSSFPIPISNIEPCNKCEQCISIMQGTNMDILEIDGASNRGIDEIRDLREKIKLSPMSARKKVYIIDEVHMLTQEAFNALLKTLEEPPSHVVFVLCTTEPHKVPATILSRCLHIQFRKATEEELIRSFERIIKKEKIKADKEALNLIASLSDGSFRDGSKLLEEIALLGGRKKITKDLVEKNYQIASIQHSVESIIKNFENRDTKSALESVSKLTGRGVEMGHFMQKLIETLHNNLLFKAGIDSAMQNSGLKIQNSKLEVKDLKRLIELLSKAYSELKYAVLPQIPLELVIVEWGISESSVDPVSMSRGPVGLHPRPTSSVSASWRILAGARRGNAPVQQANSFVRSPAPATPRVDEGPKVTQQNIAAYNENDALWIALIDKVKSYNHSIAGVLRGCRIKSYDGKSLIVEANFKFHKDKLSEGKTKEIVEKACQEITKKNVEITVLLK